MVSDNATDGVRSVVPEWRESETLSLLQQLVDLAATVPHSVARRAGMSPNELHALRHLIQQPLGPVELSRELQVTSAASSGVVDRLEAHGHVSRRPHPDDGRRTEVVITESGRMEVFHLLAPMFAALAAVDARLSTEERTAVDAFLRGVIDAMRQMI